MRVLLAIDPSSGSQHVVNEAAARPWPTGTAIYALSIVDMGRWEGLPTLIEDAKHAARILVKTATEKLDRPGIKVFSELSQKGDSGFCSGMESRLGDGRFARTRCAFPIFPRQCRTDGPPLCALLCRNRATRIRRFVAFISCHEDPPRY